MKKYTVLLTLLIGVSLAAQVNHNYPGHGTGLSETKNRTMELFSYYGGICSNNGKFQLQCNIKNISYEIKLSKEELVISYFRFVKAADLIGSYGYSNPPKSMSFINHLSGHTSIYGFPVIYSLEKQIALYNSNYTTDNYIILRIDDLGNYRFSACISLENCKDIDFLKKIISTTNRWRCDLYSEAFCDSKRLEKYLK